MHFVSVEVIDFVMYGIAPCGSFDGIIDLLLYGMLFWYENL
jgi:hypothetical protein